MGASCTKEEPATPSPSSQDGGPVANDAGAPEDAAPPPPPPGSRGFERLSQTNLYADIQAKTLGPDVLEFRPAHTLWSDGAEKTRWVRLPPGQTFDTTDPSHWVLPVGTQLWKQFVRDGKRIETRLVERIAATGNREKDYWLGAFLWREDESDADFVAAGKPDARGTTHDVPSAEACWTCHISEPGHALGFTALQLSHAGPGLTLADLRARGLVPASLGDRTVPGEETASRALGYLHANCGHCHNQDGTAWPYTSMVLRVGYGESSVTGSAVYASTVGVPLQGFAGHGFDFRIVPGDPDASAALYRMSVREDGGAMPPIATEVVDPAGLALVRAWIASLPPR